ncbi:MAG: large subunit ribosomal protein, partial [Sphingomonadales bacterium]|nr:large subunit ribosomal protein [Sphingomonadales bacterium]
MAKAAKKQAQVDIAHYDVVLAPHITEKSTLISEQNAV